MEPTAYIDTSVLVKRYVTEPGTDVLDTYLFGAQPFLFVSELTRLELTSTLARKQREGRISAEHRAALHQQADADVLSGIVKLVILDSQIIRQALTLMHRLTQPVATLDAIHLASALHQSVEIFMTDDKQLARVAREAGLQVWSTHP